MKLSVMNADKGSGDELFDDKYNTVGSGQWFIYFLAKKDICNCSVTRLIDLICLKDEDFHQEIHDHHYKNSSQSSY